MRKNKKFIPTLLRAKLRMDNFLCLPAGFALICETIIVRQLADGLKGRA
jgi:hypothetical protein